MPFFSHNQSLWWRDLHTMDKDWNFPPSWFADSVRLKLGNGSNVAFWKDTWVGTVPLRELFPRLFQIASFKDITVEGAGLWNNNSWEWQWSWRRVLFAWEEDLVLELQNVLTAISPQKEVNDSWAWLLDSSSSFSVKSAYSYLIQLQLVTPSDNRLGQAFEALWRCSLQSKILVFAWKLLWQRLPTRDALSRRGILSSPHESCCVFCFRMDESISHLFFECPFSYNLWNSILAWLGFEGVHHYDCISNFFHFGGFFRGKKLKKVRYLMWCAVVWNIWSLRNKIIFQGGVASCSYILTQIKVSSWGWFIYREGRHTGLSFSDWCICPMDCLRALC